MVFWSFFLNFLGDLSLKCLTYKMIEWERVQKVAGFCETTPFSFFSSSVNSTAFWWIDRNEFVQCFLFVRTAKCRGSKRQLLCDYWWAVTAVIACQEKVKDRCFSNTSKVSRHQTKFHAHLFKSFTNLVCFTIASYWRSSAEKVLIIGSVLSSLLLLTKIIFWN